MRLKEFLLQDLVGSYASLFGVYIHIADNDRNTLFSSLFPDGFQGDIQDCQRRFTPLRRNIQAGITLLAPECAIPFKVPNQNLRELADAAHCRRRPSPSS